jgi:hypothetical protein
MWKLICLAFTRWRRGQEQRTVDGRSQRGSRRYGAAQVGDNYMLAHEGTILVNPIAAGRQRKTDNPISESERDGVLKIENRGVRGVASRHQYLGARIGIVRHDGSYLYWEWDSTEGWVPLALV